MAESGPKTGRLIDLIYQKALGRTPSRKELPLALAMLGEPARAEGVEDLLWEVVMLPEFQLIY